MGKRKSLKTLYLLRHAKAVPEDREGDAGRPLAKRGHQEAAAIGIYLGGLKPPPRLVLCSTARRTRETLEHVLPALHLAPQVLYEEDLYLTAAERLLDRLHRLPEAAQSVLLVGHNPGLHQLAIGLARDGDGLADGLPTAALAAFGIDETWSSLRPHRATLIDYRTPKSLTDDPDFDPA